MYVNKLEHDKGELEIVYDVQWKTPGNDDDKAKIIGIVDTADTNLDWNTFKSYLVSVQFYFIVTIFPSYTVL